jgi:aminoglycoside phosphotransferase (APT) family kinase protein
MSGGDIDPRAVLSSLGYASVQALEPVLGGWETSLWRFDTPDGQRHALRVYPGPEHAGSARREEAALQACMDAGVPAPSVEATGQWEGRPLLVIGWCQGATLLAAMLRRPWSTWRQGFAFGRLQAQIHRVAPPAALLEGAPHNWMLRGALQHPEVFVGVQGMALSTASLIHLDYHPLNVLTDGRRFTGIIDWSNAAAGDRRADFARTATLLLTASAPPGPTRPVIRALRHLFYLAWQRGYVSEAGPLSDLAPFMAWAGATRLQDLEDARSRPQSWASEDDFVAAQRWVERWKRRAGIP